MSCTNTLKLARDTCPAASIAVTTTNVVPNANTLPEAAEYVSDVTPTASVAAAAG